MFSFLFPIALVVYLEREEYPIINKKNYLAKKKRKRKCELKSPINYGQPCLMPNPKALITIIMS